MNCFFSKKQLLKIFFTPHRFLKLLINKFELKYLIILVNNLNNNLSFCNGRTDIQIE